ncbi:MAG: hypothetical protein V1918_10995 [Planctomycetota bacterium]
MAMRQISIQEAKPGMVLIQPIEDGQGRVIVGAGVVLGPIHIKRLPRWGVKTLVVEEDSGSGAASATDGGDEVKEAAPPVDDAYQRQLAERLDARFHEVDAYPFMQELKQIALKWLVEAGPDAVPSYKK